MSIATARSRAQPSGPSSSKNGRTSARLRPRPTLEQINEARDEVERLLDGVDFLDGVGTFVGVAGTVTTMTALVLRLYTYERDKVHRAEMTTEEIEDITDQLLALPVSEVEKFGPVSPERAKVLAAGALIVDAVTKRVDLELQACEADILDGIAASILAGKGYHFS